MKSIILAVALIFFSIIVSCTPADLKKNTMQSGAVESEKNPDEVRMALRNTMARNYLTPESHLRLARFHYNQGSKVQAFYIAENARQVFGDEKFTPVFENVAAIKLTELKVFENEEQTEAYAIKNPKSDEAKYYFLIKKYKKLAAEDKNDARLKEQFCEELLKTLPECLDAKAFAAKYYLKGKKDKDRALDLYIDLYFHDPHFYDWEYAEFRIKQITSSEKTKWWNEKKETGLPFIDLVKNEENPRILDVAIKYARDEWDSGMIPAIMAMMDNDDPSIQSGALHTLLKHTEDIKNTDEIRSMADSDDFVKKAMAAFLVVKCLGENEYGILQENLDSGIELVQLDTMQALVFYGGDSGLEYLKNHQPKNASKSILEWWEKMATQPLPKIPQE